MKRIVLYFLTLSSLFAGCNTDTNNNSIHWENFTLSSFEKIDMTYKRGETVSPDSMDMHRPHIMRILSDRLIAIKDDKIKGKLLWILNLDNKKYIQTLYKGKSSTESNYIENMWTSDSSLFCCDDVGKILKIECNRQTMETNISLATKISPQSINATPMEMDKYLVEHIYGRYQVTNLNGDVLDTIGVFPTDQIPKEIETPNLACQVEMATAPNKKHIICANRYWNKLEIYSGNGETEHLLSGPIKIDSKITKKELSGNAYTIK